MSPNEDATRQETAKAGPTENGEQETSKPALEGDPALGDPKGKDNRKRVRLEKWSNEKLIDELIAWGDLDRRKSSGDASGAFFANKEKSPGGHRVSTHVYDLWKIPGDP